MNAPAQPGTLDRLPPHSVPAEQYVIGALLIGGEVAWDRITGKVTSQDFYRDDHRRIFRTVAQLHGAGKAVDVLMVGDALEASNESDQAGGLAYLIELANAIPSASNIIGYAEVVADKSSRRRLIAQARAIEDMAYMQTRKIGDLMDEAGGLLMQLTESSSLSDEPKHIAEVVGRAMQQIETRIGMGAVFGLPTGFADLDKATGGMHAGDLIIVAGRPSMGKTALSINVAERAALDGKAVLVFSLEMSDTQIAMRNLAAIGSASIQRVRSGMMTDEEWSGVSAAMGRLYEAKMWIDDAAGLTVAQMHSRARKIKRQNGLDLIVIDYLQLMAGEGDNRTAQISDLTRRIKLMARQLGVPVILLSQLSRKVEERADKRPLMSDLRESGSIEQDADVILMVYRDDYYNPDSTWKGIAELNIVKNRMGETGSVKLIFQGEYSRFLDADHGAIADMARAAESKPGRRSRRGMDDF